MKEESGVRPRCMKRDVGNVGEQGLEAYESEEEESGQRKVIKLNDPKEPSE